MTNIEAAWLAGILEGEGSFFLHGPKKTIAIALIMTDEDVVRKAAEFMKSKVHGPYVHPTKVGTKPRFQTFIYSSNAVELMKRLHPFMGTRRRQKIMELVEFAKTKSAQAHSRS